jgi:hypothetical protein
MVNASTALATQSKGDDPVGGRPDGTSVVRADRELPLCKWQVKSQLLSMA